MTPPLKPGWKKPLPEQLPRPTYWPAVLALGIVLALLGPVSNLGVSAVGLLAIVCALIGWIGELLHE